MAYKLQTKDGNFVDWKRISVKGGNGGNGGTSHEDPKRSGFQKPNGGRGGFGGNVFVISDPKYSSLKHIASFVQAKPGLHGRNNLQEGASGPDTLIRVPIGTLLKVDEGRTQQIEYQRLVNSDSSQENMDEMRVQQIFHKFGVKSAADLPISTFDVHVKDLILRYQARKSALKLYSKDPLLDFYDLNEPGLKVLVSRGGKPGLGNSLNQMHLMRGQPGEARYISLELKTVADVGLVGLPNAGKSSFLASVSNANPRIAPYPFTTLNPYIGTLFFEDKNASKTRMTIADIPGIIMGAHLNLGLGFSFLRHIERSKVLVYVIDVSRPEPHLDLYTLLRELEQYNPELVKKPGLVIANKIDRFESAQEAEKIISDLKSRVPTSLEDKLKIFGASAKHGYAVSVITDELKRMVDLQRNCDAEKNKK